MFEKLDGGYCRNSSMTEHLANLYKVLGSIPSTTQEKEKNR